MAGTSYGYEIPRNWPEYLLQQRQAISAPKAPRIPETTWQLHRSELESLYPRHTLKQIMGFMTAQYGFSPSQHQYTHKFSQWGLAKNNGKLRHPLPALETGNVTIEGPEDQRQPVYHDASTMEQIEDPMDLDPHASSEAEEHEAAVSRYDLTFESQSRRPGIVTAADDATALQRRGMNWIYNESDPTVELLSSSAKEDYHDSLLSDISMRDAQDTLEVGGSKSSMEESSPKTMFEPAGNAASTPSSISELLGGVDDMDPMAYVSIPEKPLPISALPMSALRYVFIDPNDPSTQKVSVLALVASVESQAPRSWMTTRDLDQMQTLADVFGSAHCYEDAFGISRMILRQCMRQTPGPESLVSPATELASSSKNESRGFSLKNPHEWQLLLINVLKNCTTVYNCEEIEAILEYIWKLMPHLQQCRSEVDCLQRSYLGSMHRLSENIRLARWESESAWDAYRGLANAGLQTGTREILHQNMLSASKDNFKRSNSKLLVFVPFDEQTGQTVRRALSNAFLWCRHLLDKDCSLSFFDEADTALWSGPASRTDLFRTEEVVLFCYLWSNWRRQASLFDPRLANDFPVSGSADCDSIFAVLETYCHVSVFDALSTLARMIVRAMWLQEGILGKVKYTPWYYEDVVDTVLTAAEVQYYRRTLAGRLVVGARRLQKSSYKTSLGQFLEAYAAPLRSKADYFSDKSRGVHVRNFVRRIINDNFELHLSVPSLERDAAPPPPPRTSFRLSMTPTMLSTPRSSWSGFASFTSLSKNMSVVRSSKGARDSSILSRSSQISSTKSIFSFLSGNSLLRESLAEDVAERIPEDTPEGEHISA